MFTSYFYRVSLVAQRLMCLPAVRETQVWFLGREDPLEKEMATHSSILAWRIPWREETGRLQSMGLQRVGYDRATSLSLSYFYSNISPLSFWWSEACFLEEIMDTKFSEFLHVDNSCLWSLYLKFTFAACKVLGSYCLSSQNLKYVYIFSAGIKLTESESVSPSVVSFPPRNWTRVSCIAGRFFFYHLSHEGSPLN